MSNKVLIVIGGPTGVGKTDMAIRLAQHYHTEIISADSRQIYTELNIGVGRPTPAQLALVRHHLIGHISIFADYSVADFEKEAIRVISQLFLQHNVVILTGGTGLYVKAIIDGLDEIPPVSKETTGRWNEIWKEKGIEPLVAAIATMDPAYLETVDRNNPRRLIRALAVCEETGQPFSSFLKGEKVIRPFDILPIVLQLPRDELYARIDQRVLHMLAHGWEDEARSLYPHRELKALQTVGYKELFDYFDGLSTMPETISAIQQSTRRYAKRQITWWRHQGQWHSFSPDDFTAMINVIDEAKQGARGKKHRA